MLSFSSLTSHQVGGFLLSCFTAFVRVSFLLLTSSAVFLVDRVVELIIREVQLSLRKAEREGRKKKTWLMNGRGD